MEFSDFSPFIAAVVAVAAIFWRVPSRTEMHREIQTLREEMRSETESLRGDLRELRVMFTTKLMLNGSNES